MHIDRLFVRIVFRFVLFSFIWFPPSLGAQTDISEQSLNEGFYAYTLENGLELYVQEDFSVPVVKTDYTARAGTSYQEPETTGFYRLYSRLFWSSGNTLDTYKKAGAGNFKAECTAHQARYSFTAAVQNFEDTFRLFAYSLKHPSFPDKTLQAEFEALKKESFDWSRSPGGFINTAVHNRVFAAAPWKKDSGVYPALFTKMNTEQIRAKLSYIRKKHYVPNQSALFISGPVKAETLLKTVQTELSDWEPGFSFAAATQTQTQTQKGPDKKKYVLVSNDFSKDLNQVLIHYTAKTVKSSLGKKEGFQTAEPFSQKAEDFAAAAWAAAHILQSKRETENIDISFSAEGIDGKLLVQTLLPAGIDIKKDNPLIALNNLSENLKTQIENIDNADMEAVKRYARLLQQQSFQGLHPFIDALSENWAHGGIEYFYEWPLAIESLNVQDVQNVFGSPWTFLIMHSSQYRLYEKEFTKNGWQLIKAEKESLNLPSGSTTSRNTTSGEQKKEKQTKTSLPEAETALENYGVFTKKNIESFTLSSGIPVSVQRLPNTAWTACILNIRGGELKHGYSKRGLENIVISNLARIVENKLVDLYQKSTLVSLPEVKTSAGLFSGNLSLSYAAQDTETVLDVLAAAFRDTEPAPARADELYFAEAYRRRTESASADAQLNEAALETFFGGTDAEPFFRPFDDNPTALNYIEIRDAARTLYKPEQLSLILCGHVQADIKKTAERYFGKKSVFYTEALKAKEDMTEKNIEPPVPAFTEGERSVRLRRLFFTDIPAELAGNRPSKLIPTTDFADPARLYLKSPPPDSRNEVLFAAILHEIAYRMTTQFDLALEEEKKTEAAAANVSAISDTEGFPIASLHFFKVKSKKGIKRAFQSALTELSAELTEKNNSDKLIQAIKSRYTQNLFFSFVTIEQRARLMQRGIETAANASQYVDRLLILDKASKEEFSLILADIQKAPAFWIFSADTKE